MEATNLNSQWAFAEIQLVYKSNMLVEDRPQILSSMDAFAVLKSAWEDGSIELYEQFKVMYIDARRRLLGIYSLSTGSMSGTFADPRLIFGAALKVPTSGIILSHNHPSGGLSPSNADIAITNKLKEVAILLDMQVLDHIIITAEGYYSFKDEGLI